MKLQRLSTVSQVDKIKVIDYELPKTPSTPFVVDDSCFIPMSEAVKQLSRVSPISADEQKMYYDFADGRDTGRKIPFERSSDYNDITELSNDIINSQKEVSESIEKTKKEIKKQTILSSSLGSDGGNTSE